jgi:hypothetical protein
MPPDVKKVRALQLNLEGLFKLLGGSSDDKERFLEIIKGITTPIEIKLINAQIDALSAHTKSSPGRSKIFAGHGPTDSQTRIARWSEHVASSSGPKHDSCSRYRPRRCDWSRFKRDFSKRSFLH